MKNIAKIALGIAGVALLASSCNKILEESPKAKYTPDYFSTAQGVEGGLTALYAQLRFLYGNGYYYNIRPPVLTRLLTASPPTVTSRTPTCPAPAP